MTKMCGNMRYYALNGNKSTEKYCSYAYGYGNPVDFVMYDEKELMTTDTFGGAFTETQYLLPDFIRALNEIPVVGKNNPLVPRTRANREAGLLMTRVSE